MIKIPGTKPGLAAIRQSIGKGININVTLLFGLAALPSEVTEAYISGLEDHLAAGHKIGAYIISSQLLPEPYRRIG